MKKNVFYFTMLLFAAFVFTACSQEDDKAKAEDSGKQAAVEFCDCYEEHGKDYCLDKLTSKYSYSDYMSNDFINAFNLESSCGIELEKIQVPK